MIIWSLICMALFLMAFSVYPTIMSNDNKEMLNQMLSAFPEEMIKMFNMDISGIDSVFGWFKTEGYVFLILILSLYSGLLGSSILLKEESDKTIEYLNSKPVSRNKIVTSKLVVGLINIISVVLLVTLFNLIGLYLSNDLQLRTFLLLSLSVLLTAIPTFTIILFISTFFNKTKKLSGLSIGVVFISYFFNMISNMGDKVEIFKYFSLFTLSDSRNIITTNNININLIIISLIISILSIIGTYIRYNKKEFI